MKRNSSSYVPVVEPTPASVMPVYGRQAETGQMPRSITDVLTIGQEATVFRPVQRALRPTGWTVAHVRSIEAALAYLRANIAAVAVADAEVAGDEWRAMVSALRNVADAPEVVVVTGNDLVLQDGVQAGAFDLLGNAFDDSDLLWAVATAWHNWMRRRERRFGGGPCSDA